jgi:hypothetical protein
VAKGGYITYALDRTVVLKEALKVHEIDYK